MMTWVIFKKDFLSFFKSPLFLLMAFLSTVMFSTTFIIGIQNFSTLMSNSMMQMATNPQQLNIHYAVFLQHLSLVNILFMFFTPALAMKLLTEEKKNYSFDLLMSSPITSSQIVMAKYLVMVAVLFVIELIAFIYIFCTVKMFNFNILPTVLTGIGIFSVGALYSALCLFAASLTTYPLIALILGTVLNLALWMIGGLADFFNPSLIKSIFEQMSVNQHLQVMIDGVIKTNSIVFFLSGIFLFCFLSERVIESSRWGSR